MTTRIDIDNASKTISAYTPTGHTLGHMTFAAVCGATLGESFRGVRKVFVGATLCGAVPAVNAEEVVATMARAFITRNGAAAVLHVNGQIAHHVSLTDEAGMVAIKAMAREHADRGHDVRLTRMAPIA